MSINVTAKQKAELKKLKVFTTNGQGDAVRVTRMAALVCLLRPYQVWTEGTPRLWRGSGKILGDAKTIQSEYPGSIIEKDGKRMKESR